VQFTKYLSELIIGLFLCGDLLCPQPSAILLAAPTAVLGRPATPKSDEHDKEELPRVIFLHQSAVLIASKKNRDKYREHQAELIDLMNKGVTVLICPDCMKEYGVKATDLIDGIQIGKPKQSRAL
jgi:DsrE/DsrF-like family